MGKKADRLFDELNELRVKTNEYRKGISWRATRYAMDGDHRAHDVMTESLGEFDVIVCGLDRYPTDESCRCKERFPAETT